MARSDSSPERKHKRKKKKRSRTRSRSLSIPKDRRPNKSKSKKSKRSKRSRSHSRSRSTSRPRNRSPRAKSRDRSRSRSKHHRSRSGSRSPVRGRRSTSPGRGRRSRSASRGRGSLSPRRRRSRSHSRGSGSRSKHSSYRNTPDSKDKSKSGDFLDMPLVEQAKIRMKAALNAVVADERSKGSKSDKSSDSQPADNARFHQSMDDINSDSFTPTAFTSSRSNPKIKSEGGFGTSGELILGPAEQTRVISTDNYAHPNLRKDPEESMTKWIIKLTSIRQRLLKDTLT